MPQTHSLNRLNVAVTRARRKNVVFCSFEPRELEAERSSYSGVKHLKDYLKQWGTKGGVDREIVAQVKLGEMKWKESCPVEGVNGACVEVIRIKASSATKVTEGDKKKKGEKKKKKGFVMPSQCGPPTKTKVILHERVAAKAKEAQGYFSAALKLYAGGAALKKVPGKDQAEIDARKDAMMYHVAQARMMQGDEQYEKLIAMKIPDKLDFTPVDRLR